MKGINDFVNLVLCKHGEGICPGLAIPWQAGGRVGKAGFLPGLRETALLPHSGLLPFVKPGPSVSPNPQKPKRRQERDKSQGG